MYQINKKDLYPVRIVQKGVRDYGNYYYKDHFDKYYNDESNIVFQLILTTYKNLVEIFDGFDIDPCKVAFNGTNLLFTERSLQCYESMIMFNKNHKRMIATESRLCKYIQKGFSNLMSSDDEVDGSNGWE